MRSRPVALLAFTLATTLSAPAYASSFRGLEALFFVVIALVLLSLAMLGLVIAASVLVAKARRSRGLGVATLVVGLLGGALAVLTAFVSVAVAALPLLLAAASVTLGIINIMRPPPR
ncbi:MAG: hypothetical protein KC503_06735 [Myxococcales bacterium]|nr:hypothetical protein [Myxococcales bacterium]